jgi:hypothetical protein
VLAADPFGGLPRPADQQALARARRTGPFAYGIVLGTGILTIVSMPAVWLGLGCCLAIGSAPWGLPMAYRSAQAGQLVLLHDARRSRTAAPGAVPMLVVGRRLSPQSQF